MLTVLKKRLEKSVKANQMRDQLGLAMLNLRGAAWPCLKRVHLVVGCESSGTTPISHFLLRDGRHRFLLEGYHSWVWDSYQAIYRGEREISDYPRLQLYDRIKVPGFAAILPDYKQAFPNASVIYCVRDPRDVLASAYRTWKITERSQLNEIDWVSQDWLSIKETDPVARLAHRWRIYLEQSLLVPDVVYVRYEDFCADKVETIRALADQVGVAFDRTQPHHRLDAQASDEDARDYRPTGSGGWRTSPFVSESDVKIVESICGNLMQKYSYQLATC